jgi:argininosuccinate lyase
MMKTLPLSYNRDMQDDKPELFGSVALCLDSVELMRAMLSDMTFDITQMKTAATSGSMTATDLAEQLVVSGMSFRDSHAAVGRIARKCAEQGHELSQLTFDQLRSLLPDASEAMHRSLSPDESVSVHATYGGPSPKALIQQLAEARAILTLP